MIFILVFSLALAAITFALVYWGTSRRVSGEWRRASPAHVANGLARRNRVVLLVMAGLLFVIALFEVLVPGLGYGIQSLQEDVFGQSLPDFALLEAGYGSISWLLYVAIWAGVAIGLLTGSLQGLRGHREFDGIGIGNLVR